MRATAESHGRDTIINGNDTTITWKRDPRIAEAMVDSDISIPGVIDSSKVLTLTAEEAINLNYCEGLATNIQEVMEKVGITNYELYTYTPTTLDKIIGLLLSSVVQGVLIIVMIGGIYFELQSPGIGFPLAAAATAAMLYFAPLYLEGLAAHWEILLFIAGLGLIALEIFVIPGFGVAGIGGIALIITGLTLSLVDNVTFQYEGSGAFQQLGRALFTVSVSVFLAFILVLAGTKRIAFSGAMRGLSLGTVQDHNDGYVSFDASQKKLVGKTGTAYTVLRPSGKIEIDDELYDAVSVYGFIDKGEKVRVTKDETGQLYVVKI